MTKSPPFNILKHLIHREPVDPIPMIYELNTIIQSHITKMKTDKHADSQLIRR